MIDPDHAWVGATIGPLPSREEMLAADLPWRTIGKHGLVYRHPTEVARDRFDLERRVALEYARTLP